MRITAKEILTLTDSLSMTSTKLVSLGLITFEEQQRVLSVGRIALSRTPEV